MALSLRSTTTRIIAGGCLAAAGALCFRYLYLDSDAVRTFCDNNPDRWFCTARATLAFGLRHPAVGWGVLALSLLALAWPSAVRLGAAVVIAVLGLVFYQADLASGAGALLLLHLALRPQAGQQQGHAS